MPADLLIERGRLEGGVPRREAVVAVQLHDQRPGSRRAEVPGERLVVDRQRTRVGVQVERVGHQVVEVRRQDDVEAPLAAGDELRQHGVARPRQPARRDELLRGRDAGRDGAARAEEECEALLLAVLRAEAPHELVHLDPPW